MSVSRMDMFWYIHGNKTLFKNEKMNCCYTQHERDSQYNCEWKKEDNNYTLYASIYIKFKNRKNYSRSYNTFGVN